VDARRACAARAEEIELDDRAQAPQRRAAVDRHRAAAMQSLPLDVHGTCERPGRGLLRVEADRVSRADETLACPAGASDVARRPRAHGDRARAQDGRPAGRVNRVVRARYARPAARGRNATDVRPEARRRVAACHEPPEKHRGRGRGDPRVDRAPERRPEGKLERAVGELRVEAADDELLRTGELPLRLGPSRRHDPWPGHRHADLKAVALARRTGRARCSEGAGDQRGE